jgi:hypothetical protein
MLTTGKTYTDLISGLTVKIEAWIGHGQFYRCRTDAGIAIPVNPRHLRPLEANNANNEPLHGRGETPPRLDQR